MKTACAGSHAKLSSLNERVQFVVQEFDSVTKIK
jgi:hypothetical protein